MKYEKIGRFVSLRQGLAINKASNHLVSEKKDEIFIYPLLRIADMMENKYTKYISKDVNHNVIAYQDDIIYTRTGQIGLVFRNFKGVVHNNSFIVSIENDELDKDYLFVLLQSEFVRKQALSLAHSSVQPDLTHDMFKSITIPIPEKEIQKEIAKSYLKLDKKIENNTHIISELESMVKTIYDYWFIQYEFPNREGKPYRSSGGKMVYNEELKKEIPEGWTVNKAGKVISVVRGISYKPKDEIKESNKDTIPLLKSNNIQNGSINFEQPVYLDKKMANEEQWLTKGSVFITMSSGSKAHMGKTAIVYETLPYVYGAFCAKINIKPSHCGFISTYFRSSHFRTYIENVTLGTSINNISNDQLTNIKLAFPEERVLEKFEKIIKPIFEKQGKIIFENQELTKLRDELLPLLMNGQVSFKN